MRQSFPSAADAKARSQPTAANSALTRPALVAAISGCCGLHASYHIQRQELQRSERFQSQYPVPT
jgi:hypothetical protein